jgi:hypothetical protein
MLPQFKPGKRVGGSFVTPVTDAKSHRQVYIAAAVRPTDVESSSVNESIWPR